MELRATRTWYVTLGMSGRYRTITQSPLELAQGLAVAVPCPSRTFPRSATGKSTTSGRKMLENLQCERHTPFGGPSSLGRRQPKELLAHPSTWPL